MTFSNGLRFVSDEATLLVKKLPWSVAEAVAEALAPVAVGDWATCRASAVRDLAHAHYRSLVVAFLDGWREQAADVSPQAVAAALLTAASTAKAYSEHQSVELVWTGPDVGVVPLRRTEQVILQVIEAATAAAVGRQLRRLQHPSRLRGLGARRRPGRGDQRHRGEPRPDRGPERLQHPRGARHVGCQPVRRVPLAAGADGARTRAASRASCTSSAPWPMAGGCSCRAPT